MQSEIWPPYEAFYIRAMLFDADIAVAIMEHIEEKALDWRPGGIFKDIGQRDFLASLQILILHGAALSRYFWPVRKDHEARGEQLRKVFGVDDYSALKNRELRNGIEHFDERLDVFLTGNPVGQFLPEYVGEIPSSAGAPKYFFRAYYPKEKIFELLGVRYQMEPIVEEVLRVHALLMAMDKTGRF